MDPSCWQEEQAQYPFLVVDPERRYRWQCGLPGVVPVLSERVTAAGEVDRSNPC